MCRQEKKDRKRLHEKKLTSLRGGWEAAGRLLTREFLKKPIDWNRARVLADIVGETLREYKDFKEPGPYDRFCQSHLGG